jgi:hypothetical protein
VTKHPLVACIGHATGILVWNSSFKFAISNLNVVANRILGDCWVQGAASAWTDIPASSKSDKRGHNLGGPLKML